MDGVAKELGGGCLFDDLAVLHDSYGVCGLVAGLGDDGEVVGDEEHGEVMGGA